MRPIRAVLDCAAQVICAGTIALHRLYQSIVSKLDRLVDLPRLARGHSALPVVADDLVAIPLEVHLGVATSVVFLVDVEALKGDVAVVAGATDSTAVRGVNLGALWINEGGRRLLRDTLFSELAVHVEAQAQAIKGDGHMVPALPGHGVCAGCVLEPMPLAIARCSGRKPGFGK